MPVTRVDVEKVLVAGSAINPNPVKAVAAIGLVPMSPVTLVGGIELVVVTPAFDKIANFPAVSKFTVARVAPRHKLTPQISMFLLKESLYHWQT